jgi:hypothetical protein
MHRVTLKTSTIFISKGNRTRVYRSVAEVPQKLRKELEETTNGFNSATILIADRKGRQEILRALHGMPSGLRSRLTSSMNPMAAAAPAEPASKIPPVAHFLRRNWLEILLPGAVGLLLWAALNLR